MVQSEPGDMTFPGSSMSNPREVAENFSAVRELRQAVVDTAHKLGMRWVSYPRGDDVEWLAKILTLIGLRGKMRSMACAMERAGFPDFARAVQSLAEEWEGPVRILHFSDIHFGPHHHKLTTPSGRHELMSASIIDWLEGPTAHRPDFVVISGDLTWQADVRQRWRTAHGLPLDDSPSEFGAVVEFLNRVSRSMRSVGNLVPHRRILVVPGNHDAAWLGDAQEFQSFQNAVHKTKFVTPYTARYKFTDLEPGMVAKTRSDADGVPVGVVKYNIRGVELVFALVMTDFYEGSLPASPRGQSLAEVHERVCKARELAARNEWASITEDELKEAIELVEVLGRHSPLISASYFGSVTRLMGNVAGHMPFPSNQVRFCVSHAPMVQVLGATSDVVAGGHSLYRACGWASDNGGEPMFNALLSGHLHASGTVRLTHPGVIAISQGTATSIVHPYAYPPQRGNSFGEITLGLNEEWRVVGRLIEWRWDGLTWQQGGRKKII